MNLTAALKRAIRTFLQGFIGELTVTGVLSGAATSGIVDWSGLKKTLISALGAAMIAVFSFLQNALEDTGAVPTLLRQRNT